MGLATRFTPRPPAARCSLCPNSLFLDGKLVITSYVSDEREPEYWKTLFDDLQARFGDRFTFIPEIESPGGIPVSEWLERYRAGATTREDIAHIKDHLCRWLCAVDGLSIGGAIDAVLLCVAEVMGTHPGLRSRGSPGQEQSGPERLQLD